MESFLERIEFLADGRSLHGWLTVGLGWSKGTVDRVRNEQHVPGAAQLGGLAITENVNLSWLLAGYGTPYVVGVCPSLPDLRAALEPCSPDESWRLGVARGSSLDTVVAWRPALYEPTRAAFVDLRIFAGRFGPEPAEWGAGLGLRPLSGSLSEIDQLVRGWMRPDRFAATFQDSLAAEPGAAYNPAVVQSDALRASLFAQSAALVDEDLRALIAIAERLTVRNRK